MASTDARPIPIKNTAFRVMFPILDNTGQPVSGAAGLDSEISKDQGTFADCTNEATEIATSSGIYYLDLTNTEMNADGVAVIVKTSTTDAKTTVLVFYPQESGDIKVDVQSLLGTAWLTPGTAGTPDVNTKLVGGQTASAAGTITFPGAIASPTNITAGTITTTTNLTNAATAGDFTATMKTSIGTAVAASAVASVTGNVGGSVGSILGVTFPANFGVLSITASTGLVDITQTAADKAWSTAARVLTAGTNIALAKGTGVTGFNDIAAADVWAVGSRTITGGTVGTITGLTISGLENMQTRWAGMTVLDGAVYQYTANALELAPSGSGLTAQQTRDAMKLAPSVGAAAAGSIDDQIADLQTSVDALAAGSGTGAYTITVTVTDGTDPLENASVRLIEGVTPYTGNTDADGEAVFALDAATYAVAVTKAGYQFTPTTRTLTGEEAGTLTNDLEMTEVVVAPPADATLCRVYAHLQTKSGAPVTGQTMTAKLTTPAKSDAMITTATITSAVSDADGLVYLDLLLPSDITPAGLKYLIEIPTANFKEEVIPTGSTYSLGQLIT